MYGFIFDNTPAMALPFSLSTIVGITDSTFSTLSLLPQLIKIVREKKAENISVWMLFILLAGLSCWIWYGYLVNDPIIMIANSISVCINMLIIFFSFKYRDR
jgi:MtN3 and saliva related transmembrane protein